MSRSAASLFAAVAVGVAAGAAAWLGAAPAFAQMAHVPENDWRQPDRHDALVKAAQKPAWTVELRFGPYLPSIDSYVPGGKTPFADVFGLTCGTSATKGSVSPRILVGLEADYLPLRIPYIGAVGPGVGWSYTSFSNPAVFTNMPLTCSGENSNLMIMPMHGSLVLRADELMRRTGIPIVPYGKFGVGLAWWRAYDDTGTEAICGTGGAARCTSATAPVLGHGSGLTPSLHFAVGGAIALNFLEPQASARLDETTGVHHAYVFGEYYNEQLTIAANALHVGASSWVAGLAVDF
jgi:hypothetical protein